jgi:hypothetical protein
VSRRGGQIVVDTTVMALLARGPDGHELRGAIIMMEYHAADGAGSGA